MTAKYLMI